MHEDAEPWQTPDWSQAPTRSSQDPLLQHYPETLAAKLALSASLAATLSADQQKVASTIQKTGGAWKEDTNGSFHLAEKYAAALLKEDNIFGVLTFAQSKPAKELAKTWNRQDRKIIEPITKMFTPPHAGDLWIANKLELHTAVFVQLVMGNGAVDPKRTIMGHAFAKLEGKGGGTGEFQLLTLQQLHEFMRAGHPRFALSDQWVLHRYLALKG